VNERRSSGVARTDVSAWYLRTDSLERDALDALSLCLSAEERNRRDRFRSPDDRRDFTAAHALLRHALSRRGTRPPQDWQFEKSPTAKPFLTNDDQGSLRFNLSHTRGLVACAVTHDQDVGVDVEAIVPLSAQSEVAAQYCSSEEREWLNTAPADEYPARLTEVWTLKEAWAKATGDGLTCRFDRLSFALPGNGGITFAGDVKGQASQFALAAPTPSHRLAVAVRLDVGAYSHLVLQEAEARDTRVEFMPHEPAASAESSGITCWLRTSAPRDCPPRRNRFYSF
jgi:4'-phosphopantetheinyl transferase